MKHVVNQIWGPKLTFVLHYIPNKGSFNNGRLLGCLISSSSGPNPPLQRAPSRNLSFQRTQASRVLFSEIPTPKRHSRNWESGHESNNIPEMPPKHQARKSDEDKLSEITTKHEAGDWGLPTTKKENVAGADCAAPGRLWSSVVSFLPSCC